MTINYPRYGTPWIVLRLGGPIERLYAYDIAVNIGRRWWHPVGRAVLWLLASEAIGVAALGAVLTRVPAVLLDPQWLERHRNRFWFRTAEGRGGNAACQYARPSIRSLVGAPPLANALSNRTTEIIRRECSRRLSRGRAPPLECLPLRFTRQGRSATSFEKQRRDGSRNTSSHSPKLPAI